MQTQTTSLIVFVKAECANYVEYYKNCLLDEQACDVLCGKRCGYFEKCVLGPIDYPYKQPGYDYAKLFAQYAEITHAKFGKVKQRKCACGEPLQQRQRYCQSCRKRRARVTGRERKRKQRRSDSPSVTS